MPDLQDHLARRTSDPDVLRDLLRRGAQPPKVRCDPGISPDEALTERVHAALAEATHDPDKLQRYLDQHATAANHVSYRAAANPACPGEVRQRYLRTHIEAIAASRGSYMDGTYDGEAPFGHGILYQAARHDATTTVALIHTLTPEHQRLAWEQLIADALEQDDPGTLERALDADQAQPASAARILGNLFDGLLAAGALSARHATVLIAAGHGRYMAIVTATSRIRSRADLDRLLTLRDQDLIDDVDLIAGARYAQLPDGDALQVLLQRGQPAELAWALQIRHPQGEDDPADTLTFSENLTVVTIIAEDGRYADLDVAVGSLSVSDAPIGDTEMQAARPQLEPLLRSSLGMRLAVVLARRCPGHTEWLYDTATVGHPRRAAELVVRAVETDELDPREAAWLRQAALEPDVLRYLLRTEHAGDTVHTLGILPEAIQACPGVAAETFCILERYVDTPGEVLDALAAGLLDALAPLTTDARRTAVQLLTDGWDGTLDELTHAAHELSR